MPTNEQISQAIAQTLKEIRAEKDFSQITLAEESGIHRTMVEKIETSKRKPTVHTIYRLCDALNMTISDFSKRFDKILDQQQ